MFHSERGKQMSECWFPGMYWVHSPTLKVDEGLRESSPHNQNILRLVSGHTFLW